MSKSIGKVFGTSSTSPYAYETNYINYLRNYNTQNYDNTLGNLTAQALNMSQNLSAMPGYQFTIDGSDAARRRAEQATYNAYADKLQPQFSRQQADLQTQLINQGLGVGTEAYQRAMSDLQNAQNDAWQQAAYQSVNAGQSAFSQSLENAGNVANFNNQARQNYIDQILSLLQGSVSGYNNQQQLYNANAGGQGRIDNAKQQAWNNLGSMLKSGGSMFGKEAK